jgi:hypothetical protein
VHLGAGQTGELTKASDSKSDLREEVWARFPFWGDNFLIKNVRTRFSDEDSKRTGIYFFSKILRVTLGFIRGEDTVAYCAALEQLYATNSTEDPNLSLSQEVSLHCFLAIVVLFTQMGQLNTEIKG